jgi:hypothetical protein
VRLEILKEKSAKLSGGTWRVEEKICKVESEGLKSWSWSLESLESRD